MRRLLIAGLTALFAVMLAGCNLSNIEAPTPTPFPTARPLTGGDVVPPLGQTTFVTATPFGNPPPAGGGIVVPTAVPTGPGANAADWIINVVVLPAWNFLYNFGMQAFGSLWNVAGVQGGVIAQGLCCVVPAILAIVLVVRWAVWGRR